MIIELDHASKKFRGRQGTVHAVNGVSARFVTGENVCLVGESGSGKTTIARLVLGLDRCTEGAVRIDGTPVTHAGQFARSVQMVFQDPFASFNPRYPIGRALTRAIQVELGVSRRQAHDRALELFERVGLLPAEDMLARLPDELSGGQRQRASIARALGAGPQFIVADEPTSMLDVSVASHILKLFRGLTRSGVSYLFITHNLAVARYIADRIVVLYHGEIVEDGPAEQIIEDPQHAYTRLLLDCTPDPAHPDRRHGRRTPGELAAGPEQVR